MRASSLIGLIVMGGLIGCEPDSPPPPPATQVTTTPASQPATKPTSKPAEPPKPVATLLDVIRRNDKTFPTTQPLAEPVEFEAAARLVLTEPTYLCSRGDLWITRADAEPTADVLKLAAKQQTHATRERVSFVYWRPGPQWSAELVVREGDRDVWVTATRRLPLEGNRVRDWSRATIWNSNIAQSVVVPCADGISILSVAKGGDRVDEQFVKLLDATPPGSGVFSAVDPRGILAWSSSPRGDSTVARFLDGKWTLLTPASAWPKQLLHVVPFEDGTVLALQRDGDAIKLRSVLLDPIPVDEAKVAALVKELTNRDPEARQRAQSALSMIGPGAWPVLERIRSAQPAEARARIGAILGDQSTPSLGGVTPEPGPARLVSRLPDGGVVLYFAGGASAVDANGLVQTSTPAWLAVRPTRIVEAMPDALVRDANPAKGLSLKTWSDEWILEHDVDGPMRWMGNHNERLTRGPRERDFKRFVGIDASSRWVLKTIDPDGPTLIIDPLLPDPTPRLPVWTINLPGGSVGWTDDNWPAMQRGGAWQLKESSWAAIKTPAGNAKPFNVEIVAAATQGADGSLLTDSAGNRYTGGLSSLSVRRADGTQVDWPLPPEAAGEGLQDGSVVLIEAEGKLFLCNQPGRIVRLTPQLDDASEPFKLDATFTRNLPASGIRRIWKDPAGRLVIASNGNCLSIAFPSGRISGPMANMIPAGQWRDAFEREDDMPQ